MKCKRTACALSPLIIICFLICSASDIPKLGQERHIFYEALKRSEVINPAELVLTHFSHIGNLHMEGEVLYVLDVREIIPDMAAPRGLNKIVILNKNLEVLHVIRYIDERPLRCDGNTLLLFGDIIIHTIDKHINGYEGNLLIFSDKGKKISVGRTKWNKLLPNTNLERKTP
ncbi:hypothetical protein [Desulfonema magnum]|uniref:Uncharacterized protein n=1 Tax=Desulfonema magnum TaxID=45655 RepID=A0A975BIB0_9BACT|nr:hypothetical protein [Desulfonema magnum]QTA85835.1 Uncharacterized protein dnm_018500 [Desulfonema magnum]